MARGCGRSVRVEATAFAQKFSTRSVVLGLQEQTTTGAAWTRPSETLLTKMSLEKVRGAVGEQRPGGGQLPCSPRPRPLLWSTCLGESGRDGVVEDGGGEEERRKRKREEQERRRRGEEEKGMR